MLGDMRNASRLGRSAISGVSRSVFLFRRGWPRRGWPWRGWPSRGWPWRDGDAVVVRVMDEQHRTSKAALDFNLHERSRKKDAAQDGPVVGGMAPGCANSPGGERERNG